MRSAAEASWAVEDTEAEAKIDDEEQVRIFVTGTGSRGEGIVDGSLGAEMEMEMDELTTEEEPVKATGGRDRMDVERVVGDVFRMGKEERVAILVCGPVGLAGEVREEVGKWVRRGRDVW